MIWDNLHANILLQICILFYNKKKGWVPNMSNMRLPFDINRFQQENALYIAYYETSIMIGVFSVPIFILLLFVRHYSFVFDILIAIAMVMILNCFVSIGCYYELNGLLKRKAASNLYIYEDEVRYRSRMIFDNGLFKPKTIEKYNYSVKSVDEYYIDENNIYIYGCIHKYDCCNGYAIEVVHELTIPNYFQNKKSLIECLEHNRMRYSSMRHPGSSAYWVA